MFEALERVLFDIEPSWELAFAGSAELAFAELTRRHFDVVVTELRLSGIDGAALLSRVRELYPRTVRIVLTGHSDEGLALKLVRVAHQFLAKPCAAELLHRIIMSTAQLNQMLDDPKLQSMIGQVEALPSAPHLQEQLRLLLDRPDSTLGAVAAVVTQDPAMTSKLLQVTGSAFFNSSASVTDVETAVARPRVSHAAQLEPQLQSVRAGAAQPRCAQHLGSGPAAPLAGDRPHGVAHGQAAGGRLGRLLAGLLCDVGQLVLASNAPERLYVTAAEAQQAGVPAHVAEKSTWGATHAEIGAYLLGLWGLPFQVVDAVAKHHAPERQAGEHVGLPQLVWLAACVVDGQEPAREFLHRFGAEELYATSRRAFEALH